VVGQGRSVQLKALRGFLDAKSPRNEGVIVLLAMIRSELDPVSRTHR